MAHRKTRTEIIAEWSQSLVEIKELEKKRDKLKKRVGSLEEKYKWLGTVKGLSRRDGEASVAKKEKVGGKRTFEQDLSSLSLAKKRKRFNYSEEEKKEYREWRSSVNRLEQLERNKRRVDPDDLRKAVERAKFYGKPLSDVTLTKLANAAGLEAGELRNVFIGAPERLNLSDEETDIDEN